MTNFLLLLGDFNDNIANDHVSNLTAFILSHVFKQYVSQPTTDAGSLLDHIYLKICDDNFNVGIDHNVMIDVHDVYYSDDDAVFLTTNFL